MRRITKVLLFLCLGLYGLSTAAAILLDRTPYAEQDYCLLTFTKIKYVNEEGGLSTPYAVTDPYDEDGCTGFVYLNRLVRLHKKVTEENVFDTIQKSGLTIPGYCGTGCQYIATKGVLTREELNEFNKGKRKRRLYMCMIFLIYPLIILLTFLKRKHLPWLVLFFGITPLQGQTQQLKGTQFPTYVISSKTDTVYTYAYDSLTRIYNQKLAKADISLQYPEEVLVALINGTDNSWVDFYAQKENVERKYKKPEHYSEIAKTTGTQFYFQPVLKFQYTHEGEDITFIRYRIVDERVPFNLAAVSAIVFEDNKYLLKTSPTSSAITFALTYLKKEVLFGLLNPGEAKYSQFRSRISKDGRVDLSLLGAYFMRWFQRPDVYSQQIADYMEKI